MLDSALTNAHSEATAYEAELAASKSLAREDPQHGHADMRALLSATRAVLVLLNKLEDARNAWWAGNSERRRLWIAAETEDAAAKLKQVNLINNRTRDMIADMELPVGRFCRYTLGLEVSDVRSGNAVEELEIKALRDAGGG